MKALILLAAAALLLGKRTVKQAEKIQIEPKGLTFDKAQKKFILTLTAINPTNKEFQIDSMFLTISNNDKKIGTVEKFTPFTVTKLGRSDIQLPVMVNPSGLGQFIADTFITKIPENIAAKGELRYKGLSVPINEKLDLKTL